MKKLKHISWKNQMDLVRWKGCYRSALTNKEGECLNKIKYLPLRMD